MILFLIVSTLFPSCEKEPNSNEKIEITIPYSFIITPDTVSNQANSIQIKFDCIETNGCKHYEGVKIVSEGQDDIDLQLIIEDASSPEVECATAIYHRYDSLMINIENKIEININFLNEKTETVFTRKIIKTDNKSSDFVLKYERASQSYDYLFIDTMSVIFHNHKKIEESKFLDTVFINASTGFVINKKDVPLEYSQLYYTLTRYFNNCESGRLDCPAKIRSLSGNFTIKRNIPEVIKVHEEIY